MAWIRYSIAFALLMYALALVAGGVGLALGQDWWPGSIRQEQPLWRM